MVRSLVLLLLLSGCAVPKKMLVISKTAGYRHTSIETGLKSVSDLARSLHFEVVATEDCSLILEDNYDVVVFLNTTGDILNDAEQNKLKTNLKRKLTTQFVKSWF